MSGMGENQGFVLICDADGTVRSLTGAAAGIANVHLIGESLLRLFDVANVGKGLRFLNELRTKGIASAWEIKVGKGDAPTTMRFAGVQQDGDLIILAAPDDEQILVLYEDLVRLHRPTQRSVPPMTRPHPMN